VARRLVLVRITVECGGFTRAADACLTANHTSALLTESLATMADLDLGVRTGVTVGRDGSATTPTAVRVVLLADARTANGWRILTAFPD
jgi:hypothetical protein